MFIVNARRRGPAAPRSLSREHRPQYERSVRVSRIRESNDWNARFDSTLWMSWRRYPDGSGLPPISKHEARRRVCGDPQAAIPCFPRSERSTATVALSKSTTRTPFTVSHRLLGFCNIRWSEFLVRERPLSRSGFSNTSPMFCHDEPDRFDVTRKGDSKIPVSF